MNRFTALALLLGVIAGCAKAAPAVSYEPGQAIEMGPWKFAVEEARDSVEDKPGVGRMKTVTVTLRLVNYMERHEQPFDNFLMRYKPGAMFMRPSFQLVDEHGTPFDGTLSPLSGGSMRSERWHARFALVPADAGAMDDVSELAPRYADAKITNLDLVIENPDCRSGQPQSVIIALK